MIKYLAILKDSLREALDTKVFYVTVGLSCLLILTVASVSFQPVTVEDEAQRVTAQLTSRLAWFFQLAGQGHPPRYEIADFQQTNDASEPWRGDYRFVLVVRFPDAQSLEQAQQRGLPVSREAIRQILAQSFWYLEDLQVGRNHSSEAALLRFPVTSHGTKVTEARSWPHQPSIFFGLPLPPLGSSLPSLAGAVYWIEDTLVNGIGAWVGILAGVVITASFIPSMLRKGTVDLLLVKPIHRTALLLWKYLGGLLFVFLNAALAVGGVWLALGLRSGIWAPGFLGTVLVITYFFAILYAVSTLAGVLTRSVVVAILVTVVAWFAMFLVGWGYQVCERLKQDQDRAPAEEQAAARWFVAAVEAAHYVLPRTRDLDLLTTRLLSHEILSEAEIHQRQIDRLPAVAWGESLTISGIFIAVLLGLSCLRFALADY